MFSVPAFFVVKIASALFLLKLSASFLPVGGFSVFAQLMLFAALLNVLSLCGAQNGVVRQAAAARDLQEVIRTQSAAFAIWSVTTPLALLLALVGGGLVSRILVGSPAEGRTILAITAVVVAGAPSGIWCALLTGRKRVAQSLAAQAAGLVSGAAVAAWRITAHDPPGAALAFAGGSLVTACVALPFTLRLGLPLIPPASGWPPIRILLRYSAAFAATSGYTAIVVFGLRWIYREQFGVTQLGYWVAANRASDMATQLMGLFMLQVFVPHLAMTHDEGRRRAFLVRCWTLAAGVMACAPVVFSLAPGLLIHVFLSDAYLPAASMIRAYMIGDLLRVWPSLAMHTAFANGQPLRYAGMEMGVLTVMAAVTVVLTAAGDPAAPQIGYVVAQGIAATLVSVAFFLRPVPAVA
jgi:hypothetical protein